MFCLLLVLVPYDIVADVLDPDGLFSAASLFGKNPESGSGNLDPESGSVNPDV